MAKKEVRSRARKAVRSIPARVADVPKGVEVKGGHRAGGDKPVKYMEIKLKEVLISG